MGIFDVFKTGKPQADAEGQPQSKFETECEAVKGITSSDMIQFDGKPFHFSNQVQYQVSDHSHPYAYIRLDADNIEVALSELEKMNDRLAAALPLVPTFPMTLSIPLPKIVFRPPYRMGYTVVKCSPYTPKGRPAKHPFSLSFMTNLWNVRDEVHGELFYTQSGKVGRAEVFFWRGDKGYFFYFAAVSGDLVLRKAEAADTSGITKIVYTRK